MALKILQYPEPSLRQASEPVDLADRVVRAHVRALAWEMIATMHDAKGWGLAAPQVGVNIRMFVMFVPDEMREPLVFVNPKIEEFSKDTTPLREGCLSFKTIFDTIYRPRSVRVARYDEEGRFDRRLFTGWMSRCIQHEIEHLNGMLLIDQMTPVAAKKLDKIMRKKFDGKATQRPSP